MTSLDGKAPHPVGEGFGGGVGQFAERQNPTTMLLGEVSLYAAWYQTEKHIFF